jgi:hypothetical protein
LTWGVLTAVPHLRNSAIEAGRYGSPRSAPPCPARSNKHDRGAVTVELNCRSASNSRVALRFVLRDETILQVYINPHHNPFHLRVSIQSTQFTKPYHPNDQTTMRDSRRSPPKPSPNANPLQVCIARIN